MNWGKIAEIGLKAILVVGPIILAEIGKSKDGAKEAVSKLVK